MALLFEEVGETSLDDSVITDVLPSIPDIPGHWTMRFSLIVRALLSMG